MPEIMLDNGQARVDVTATLGGSLGRYEVRTATGWAPIFDLSADPTRSGAFALGCQVMIPFVNRISGGGFHHAGRFHRLEPNLAGDRYPIHGNGFQQPWTIREASTDSSLLTLESMGPGPFRYAAELSYRLENATLWASLVLTNLADDPMPYGLGFHPWFLRTPQTQLRFKAAGYWTEQDDYLLRDYHPLAPGAAFDFSADHPLPESWINTNFVGWVGSADIIWSDLGRGVRLDASGPLGALMVYSPSGAARHVCVEPVSHTVDAHNRSGAGHVSPHVLVPGEKLSATMAITPFMLDA